MLTREHLVDVAQRLNPTNPLEPCPALDALLLAWARECTHRQPYEPVTELEFCGTAALLRYVLRDTPLNAVVWTYCACHRLRLVAASVVVH